MARTLIIGLALLVATPTLGLAKGKLRVVTRALKRPTQKFRMGGKDHYQVRLRLKGPRRELSKVALVEYKLHPVFRQRTRTSRDAWSKFGVNIWTYGYFKMDVNLHMKDGSTKRLEKYVKFDPNKAHAKPEAKPAAQRVPLRQRVESFLRQSYDAFGRTVARDR